MEQKIMTVAIPNETKNEDGTTTVVLNPDSPNDRLWFGLRAFTERPDIGALIRTVSVTTINSHNDSEDGRLRQEIIIRVVIDTKEPKTIEELKTDEERAKFTEFLHLYMKDPASAFDRPASDVSAYMDRIEDQAEKLGISTANKSTRNVLVEIANAIQFQLKAATKDGVNEEGKENETS